MNCPNTVATTTEVITISHLRVIPQIRLQRLGPVLQYPYKSMFFVLYFRILMIIIHH